MYIHKKQNDISSPGDTKLKIIRENNPILSPSSEQKWMSRLVMNPGVIYDRKKYRMVFTASGGDGSYWLGYAESDDGIHFSCNEEPFFCPNEDEDAFDHGTVEDPRITYLDGTFYITYAARFMNINEWSKGKRRLGPGGDNAPSWERNNRRVGLAATEDWKTLKRLGPLSSEHLNDANVVLFPEKINGKYVYLHRPSSSPAWLLPMHYEPGRTWILFTDEINRWASGKIAEPWHMTDGVDIPDDYMLLAPEQPWESMKVGPSGVPLPTDDGWLMFYHGVDRKGTYRIGLALLDRENPGKVLCRTPAPVMEPEGEIELKGGPYPGCIFPCANLRIGDEIRLYYGICDKHIGSATVKFNDILNYIKKFPVR